MPISSRPLRPAAVALRASWPVKAFSPSVLQHLPQRSKSAGTPHHLTPRRILLGHITIRDGVLPQWRRFTTALPESDVKKLTLAVEPRGFRVACRYSPFGYFL